MYDTILFDLDGTLTDSGLGITKAVQYALGQMGFEVPPREALFSFIGPPLHTSFQRHYGMDEETSREAVRQFRVYYNQMGGILENEVYPGVRELLADLKKAGKRLVIATSKPQAAAELVMHHFGLDEWVPEIIGGTDDPRRNTKGKVIATSKPQAAAEKVMHHFGLSEFVPEIIGGTDDPRRNTKGKVIGWALRENGIDPKTAVMVGDREHDIHGAAENGIPAIGITWGYGDRAELENAGAKAVFDTPRETVDYILRGSF